MSGFIGSDPESSELMLIPVLVSTVLFSPSPSMSASNMSQIVSPSMSDGPSLASSGSEPQLFSNSSENPSPSSSVSASSPPGPSGSSSGNMSPSVSTGNAESSGSGSGPLHTRVPSAA